MEDINAEDLRPPRVRRSATDSHLLTEGFGLDSAEGRPVYKKLEAYKLTRSRSNNYFLSLSDSPNPEEWTSFQLSKQIETPKSSGHPLLAARYPSVLRHDKTPGVEKIELEVVSPLTENPLLATTSNISPNNNGAGGGYGIQKYSLPYSSLLSPIETNSKNGFSRFHEATTGIEEKESQNSPESFSRENEASKKFKLTRLLLLNFVLVGLIILLICAFVPPMVILSGGTKGSVLKFFRKEGNRNEMLPMLMEKYGYLNQSRPGISEVSYKVEKPEDPYLFGLAYSPINALEPRCGLTKNEAILDLLAMQTVTGRIRNYGMQCNQSELILDSIQSLNLNMKLAMGVWIGTSDKINDDQMRTMKSVLSRYPRNLFESIFVGNEVLFRGDKTTKQLLSYINETRQFVHSLGYDIPVGTSEIGSLINTELIEGCDIIGANIHPFFGGEEVEKGSEWTLDFLKYQIEPINSKNTTIVITEVGWPSSGGRYQKALASIPNLKYLLEDFPCKARASGYGYYFFEAFDEPWKKVFYSGKNKWETEWGIFDKDRKKKVDFKSFGC